MILNTKTLFAFAFVLLMPWLSVADQAGEIAKVKAIFAEVNSADLKTESFEYNDPPTGSSGEVVQFVASGSSDFRKLKVSVSVDDGGSTLAEFYLDKTGELRFVFVSRDGMEYDSDGDSYLVASQLRLYFDAERNLLRALVKEARADSPEEMGKALEKSENKEVSVASIPARRIVDCVEELCRGLYPERTRDASQLTMAALAFYDEPEPPADKQKWVSIPVSKDKTYPSKKATHEIFNGIIGANKLPHPEADAPAIHLYHTHRYPGDFSVSTLATTDRLYHDSIDSVRYRMDIRESPDKKIHVSFFGYQIRPRGEEPRNGTRNGWVAEEIKNAAPSE